MQRRDLPAVAWLAAELLQDGLGGVVVLDLGQGDGGGEADVRLGRAEELDEGRLGVTLTIVRQGVHGARESGLDLPGERLLEQFVELLTGFVDVAID